MKAWRNARHEHRDRGRRERGDRRGRRPTPGLCRASDAPRRTFCRPTGRAGRTFAAEGAEETAGTFDAAAPGALRDFLAAHAGDGIDIAVNNLGVSHRPTPFGDLPENDLDRVLGTGPIESGKVMSPPAEVRESIGRHIPMQRMGRAEAVAEAIAWLASPSASFVTGVALPVDGGKTAAV